MKKIVTIILLVFTILLLPYNTNALVTTYNRTSENNYGVNKKWEVDEYNINNVTSTPYVDASKKIYDFSNILTETEEIELRNKIQTFINLTNMDMVILTYDLPYTYDSMNEVFATDFYDYNDFGIDFEHYSGILLFRNTYEQDRYYDIYTFGEAQLYLGDDRFNAALDKIYYDFVNDNYLRGMSTFINDMTTYYNDGIDEEFKNYYIDDFGFFN